jgi:hypothetical protein
MGNCLPNGIFIKRYANLEKQKEKEVKKKTNNITIIEDYIDTQNDNHKLDDLIEYLDTNISNKPIIYQENLNENIKYNTFIITRIKTTNIKRQNTV